MREKLIELPVKSRLVDEPEDLADYLTAHGVTLASEPISYDRLLKLAKKMHTWIFFNSANEKMVYYLLGLTEEENRVFGYDGRTERLISEAPKEVE